MAPKTIMIAVDCQAESSMGPVTPLMVAEALVNATDPKFASGKMPEVDEGARRPIPPTTVAARSHSRRS